MALRLSPVRLPGVAAILVALSLSAAADQPGIGGPTWRSVPTVTFEVLPPPPAAMTGLRGLNPIPAPVWPAPGDPRAILYITPENPQGVLVPIAPARVGEGQVAATFTAPTPQGVSIQAGRVTPEGAGDGRSFTLSDALRDAAWRKETAARLEGLADDRP